MTRDEVTELELRADDAERALIGAVAFHPAACSGVLAGLDEREFHNPHRQSVWEVMRRFSAGRDPITPGHVVADLKSREAWTAGTAHVVQAEMTSAYPAHQAHRHADLIRDLAARRDLLRRVTRIQQISREDHYEPSELLGRMRDVFDEEIAGRYAADSDAPLRWRDLLAEFDAEHSGDPDARRILTPWIQVDRLLGGLYGTRMYVLGGRPGTGKALALDTPIPTPTGWATMGGLASGDQVLGADGRPTTVTRAFDAMNDRPCFEVEFSDGSVIVADAEHQWLTETRASRKSAGELARRAPSRGLSPFGYDQRHKLVRPSVVTTRQIAATLRVNADQRLNHSIPTCSPLALPDTDLIIPPYVLGVWLGDGTSATAEYTSADPEIAAHVEADGLRVEKLGSYLRYALKLPKVDRPALRKCGECGSQVAPCPWCGDPTPRPGRCLCWPRLGTVTARLRTIGVLGDKHVPGSYLRASDEQRRALLAGLLDTDGTVTAGGHPQIALTCRRLATNVHELIVSLGYRPTWAEKPVRGRNSTTSVSYTISFPTSDEVFRLERKRLLHKERHRTDSVAYASHRYIVDVRPVPSVPVRCIQVDNVDHLYLAGRSMIPTHNSTAGIQIAVHAARTGRETLICSREMPSVDVTGRILAAGAEVDIQEVNARRISRGNRQKLDAYADEIGDLPLTVDARPRNLTAIKTLARAHAHRYGLDLLLVDYLQLVHTDQPSRTREQEVAQVSMQLKRLALELNIAVVVPAQLNRGSLARADQKPTMADLRDSGQIEQDADVVILLHRDKNPESHDPNGKILFIVDKNRHGPTAELTLGWFGGYGQIA